MTTNPNKTAPNAATTTIRLTLDVVLDLNGVPSDHARERIEGSILRAIGNGALTGDSEAECETYDLKAIVVEPLAVSLDEEQVADWITRRVEDGELTLEDLPSRMARYALQDPGQMRNEIAERMVNSVVEEMADKSREADVDALHFVPLMLASESARNVDRGDLEAVLTVIAEQRGPDGARDAMVGVLQALELAKADVPR